MLKFMTARANGKKGELFLYGDIGSWFDGPSTASINDELKAVGAVDDLDVYVNSAGGSIVDGMGIYQMLLRNKARKVAHIDYLAASIASVICMACDEIRIAGNGRMMIHRASGGAFGNPDEIISGAEALRGMEQDIEKTYAARTGQSIDKVREMMAAETWMSAQQAKELGFVDAIDPLKGENRAPANRIDSLVLNRYRNVPAELRPDPKNYRALRLMDNENEVARIKRNRASPATA